MSYKCYECGHVFEEPDTWQEDRGEYFGHTTYEEVAGCPICGGCFVVASHCDHCDEDFTDEEIAVYSGWCENCLEEHFTADRFFKYCEARKEEHIIEDFVMTSIFCMDTVKHPTTEFHEMAVATYKARAEVEMDFAGIIKDFMHDNSELKEDFADFLNEKGVR